MHRPVLKQGIKLLKLHSRYSVAEWRGGKHCCLPAPFRGMADGPRKGAGTYLLSWGNKPWERLANRLKAENVESVYLERLERGIGRKVTMEDQIQELEQEILQETASALRRSEDKINYLLLQLEVKGLDIDTCRCDDARRKLITEFNKLRKDALDARSDLTIHREACGIRIKNWERTLRLYPVPPRCPSEATKAPKTEPEMTVLETSDFGGRAAASSAGLVLHPSLYPTLSDREKLLEAEREKVRERARQRAQEPPKVWTQAERVAFLAGKYSQKNAKHEVPPKNLLENSRRVEEEREPGAEERGGKEVKEGCSVQRCEERVESWAEQVGCGGRGEGGRVSAIMEAFDEYRCS